MKTKVAVVVSAILAIALTTVLAFCVRLSHRAGAIPKPIHQSFGLWDGPLVTPPLAAGRYWISLEYAKRDPGRLDAPLKVKLVDATASKVVATGSDLVGAKSGNDEWEEEIAGEFIAIEGHRYQIDVDADQLRELSRYRHRLTVDLTMAERENRMMKALFE